MSLTGRDCGVSLKSPQTKMGISLGNPPDKCSKSCYNRYRLPPCFYRGGIAVWTQTWSCLESHPTIQRYSSSPQCSYVWKKLSFFKALWICVGRFVDRQCFNSSGIQCRGVSIMPIELGVLCLWTNLSGTCAIIYGHVNMYVCNWNIFYHQKPQFTSIENNTGQTDGWRDRRTDTTSYRDA